MTSDNAKRDTLNWLNGLFVLYAVVSPLSISATNIALGAIILSGFLTLFLAKPIDRRAFDGKLALLMLLLFAWSALTRLFSGSPVNNAAISNIWEYAPIVLLPAILNVSEIKKERAIIAMLVSSSLICLLGILQYISPSIVYPFPKQMIREHFKGFFSHHLHSGGFYGMTTILAFSLAAFWKEAGKIKKYLWLFFILNLAGLVLTMARSYMISVPLIILLFFINIKNWKWLAFGFALFGLLSVLLVVFPNPVKDRFEELRNPGYRSSKERVLMWKAAIDMVMDHPVAGVGKDNWTKEAKGRYFPPIEKEYNYKIMATGHAHNAYLAWAAETGIVGISLFLAFWLSVARRLFAKSATLTNGSFEQALTIGTIGSLGNLFIAGMFENNFGTSVVLLLLSFLIGLSLGNGKDAAAK